ncbi:MAG: potassium channel family protein [Deltaproteobacteria bacterium]|nr:potassium channel family protein [Deltaproteobacteria bacterium]
MDDQTCISFGKWCFKGRFMTLLVLILAMLIVAPLAEELIHIRMLMDIFWSAVFIGVIYAVSHKKRHILIAVLLVLPMLGSIWSSYFVKLSALGVVGGLCGAAFFIFAIIQILIFIYSQKKVTRDLIVGAAIVYLLMALAWSFIFAAVEGLHPGSFSLPEIQGISTSRSFLYYSFVTLTTLGYGDITPVTSLARSLSTLEAVIGQLYLVVQVAWLVGVHVSQSMLKRSE